MVKKHFFVGCDGELFDTRPRDWSKNKPLRAVFEKHYGRIHTGTQLRATLRAGAYTKVGGYPLYFVTNSGGALSFEVVEDELFSVIDSIRHHRRDGWRVVAVAVNWEDSDLYCDHTGERIESAYDDDETYESEQ